MEDSDNKKTEVRMINPNSFRQSIRELFGSFPEGSGGCYKFARLLRDLYGGEIFYNNDHCITKIQDKFYDLFGEYEEDGIVRYFNEQRLIEFPISDFLPISKFNEAKVKKSFYISKNLSYYGQKNQTDCSE